MPSILCTITVPKTALDVCTYMDGWGWNGADRETVREEEEEEGSGVTLAS
jgi:hypothetical protein